MKNIHTLVYLVLGTIGLFCFHPGHLDATDKQLNDFFYTPAERDSLMNILVGEWLEKDYLDVLLLTKSPIKAVAVSAESNGGTYFKISQAKDDINSFYLVGLDVFDSGYGGNYKLSRNDSLIFENIRLPKTEKGIIYSRLTSGKDIAFVKVPPINEYVNSIVLEGTYINTQLPESNPIIFNKNGTISGLAECTKYYIQLSNIGSAYDRVDFGRGNSDENNEYLRCIFKIKDKKLLLYQNVKDPDDCRETKGKLLYSLKRIALTPKK